MIDDLSEKSKTRFEVTQEYFDSATPEERESLKVITDDVLPLPDRYTTNRNNVDQ